MLVVTENGVQVLLKQTPTPNTKLRDAILIAVLFAINGILGFWFHLYSVGVAMLINVIIIIISASLQTYRKRHQPAYLSGGDLLLSPNAFNHTFLGKTTNYQLTQFDNVQVTGDTLQIANNHKILYQIQGFSEPKQLEVAQAVLNGKTIQTQGKAIKMQSN